MADIRRVHRAAKSSLNTNNEQDNYNYTTSSSTKFLDSNENTSSSSSSKKAKKSSHGALVEDSSSLATLSSSRKSKKSDVASFKTSRAIVPSPPDYSYNNNNSFSNKYYDKLDPDDLANTLKPRASNKNSHSSRTKVRASFSKSLSRSEKRKKLISFGLNDLLANFFLSNSQRFPVDECCECGEQKS